MSRLKTVALWVPLRIRKEFKTRGGDARFLVWVSFLLAFAWARTWVTVIGPYAPHFVWHDEFEFGRRIVIAGYHPHHIALGVLLLAVAGWIGIHWQGRQLNRFAGVLYGVGLGLIVDEIGFIVEGITPYQNDWVPVFVVVVVMGSLFMSAAYFRSFWNSLEGRMRLAVRFAFRRHQRRQAVTAPVLGDEDAVPVPLEARPPGSP